MSMLSGSQPASASYQYVDRAVSMLIQYVCYLVSRYACYLVS